MKPVKTLDIGDVVKLSGLSPATLRFYEEKGLIRSTGRNGLRRLFSSTTLERLEFIALAQKASFTLDQIAKMFSADGRLKIDRPQLMAKAKEVEAQMKSLAAVRDGLQHVANCPAKDHLECPKFQRLLRVAGKAQAKARPRN